MLNQSRTVPIFSLICGKFNKLLNFQKLKNLGLMKTYAFFPPEKFNKFLLFCLFLFINHCLVDGFKWVKKVKDNKDIIITYNLKYMPVIVFNSRKICRTILSNFRKYGSYCNINIYRFWKISLQICK